MSRRLIRRAPFEIRARVAMQLGRESISSSLVAILELVKNAYDADARNVNIRFSGIGTPDAKLVISDDGTGMTKKQLLGSWMVIGTDDKQKAGRSSGGRILTGAKGLGRLGLDRLSKYVMVSTYVKGASVGTQLEIDWSKYEKPSIGLGKIKHPIYQIAREFRDPINDGLTSVESGTWLVLSKLTDEWDSSAIDALEQELGLLVSPFAAVNDFAIWIDSDPKHQPKEMVKSSSELLEVAEWKLTAEITEKSQVQFLVESKIHQRKYEQPPIDWQKRFKKSGTEAACGPLRFELFYFVRKAYELDDKSISRGQISRFLDSNQGVRIYRDGFRVKPFGQPDGTGDWLALSFRRQKSPGGVTQTGYRLGYNQIVGAVFISREHNPNLIDQTNRENLVEGTAFHHLRQFTLAAIEYLEGKRQEFERERPSANSGVESARRDVEAAEEESRNALEKLRYISETVKSEAKDVETANQLSEAIEELQRTQAESDERRDLLVQALEQEKEAYERQKDTLSNLASLGILSVSFGHETLGRTTNLLLNARQLKRELDKSALLLSQDAQENLKGITVYADRIKSYAEFMLSNVSRDKRKRKALTFADVLGKLKTAFDDDLKTDRSIEFDISEVSPNLPKILAFEIDWESVFLNLLTNSIWALQDTPAHQRRICVRAYVDSDELVIVFADSGWGLESGTEDRIFEPTFSTRRNPRGDVIGTGMGLAIVQSLVRDSYGGGIETTSHGDLGGAQFTIKVPIPDLTSRGK